MLLRGFRHHLLGVASHRSVPCQSSLHCCPVASKIAREKGVQTAAGRCRVVLLLPYFLASFCGEYLPKYEQSGIEILVLLL